MRVLALQTRVTFVTEECMDTRCEAAACEMSSSICDSCLRCHTSGALCAIPNRRDVARVDQLQ